MCRKNIRSLKYVALFCSVFNIFFLVPYSRVGSHVVFAWIHCADVRIHCTDILFECR